MCTLQNIAGILQREQITSVPQAIREYLQELRSTEDDQDYLHANTLEYLLKTFENKEFIEDFCKTFNKIYSLIEEEFPSLRFKIDGRRKSLISTEAKILTNLEKGIPLDTIRDFLGVRILIIANDGDTDACVLTKFCYDIANFIIKHLISQRYSLCEARSINKDAYKGNEIYIPETSGISPKFTGYVKDYIKFPKEVGYQSLHTAFRFPDSNDVFELQIRTFDQNLFAESGEANHHDYKKRTYGILEMDREKIHIPGYAVARDGSIHDFVGLEKGYPLLACSNCYY